MNEAETRAELIDPKLRECGWGVVDGTKVLREYRITAGRMQSGGEELAQEKLPDLLMLKYRAIGDAEEMLGGIESIRETFIGFQKYLYEQKSA